MAERVDGWAAALFEVARAEGALEKVEEELFSFSQALQGSDELRSTLTDERIPAARRQAVVENLLGDRASPVTSSLISFVVGAGRGRDLPTIVERFVAMAAESRQHAVAEVRSAIPIDDDQRRRLEEALSRATKKQIEVKVIVDPTVLGGLVAQVGDTVIDDTVRHRLEQLKARL